MIPGTRAVALGIGRRKKHPILRNLLRNDEELGELLLPEDSREGHIARVATPGNNDAPDAAAIVPGVERIPPPSEIHFHPRAKVHRIRSRGNADVTEIACDVTSRHIQATAECDGKMRKVPANTNPLAKSFQRRPVGPGFHVVKLDVTVDEIADSLNARPPRRSSGKIRPREVRKLAIDFAVAAWQQIDQVFRGKPENLLLRSVRREGVRRSAVAEDASIDKADDPRFTLDPPAPVSVGVGVFLERPLRIDSKILTGNKIFAAGRMDSQAEQHGGFHLKAKRNIVAKGNMHFQD